MNHFMLLIDGIKPAKGEVYGADRGGRTASWVSTSSATATQRPVPHPLPARPAFPICSAFVKMVEGGMIADAIAVLGQSEYRGGGVGSMKAERNSTKPASARFRNSSHAYPTNKAALAAGLVGREREFGYIAPR
jgi:hypothetical protein